MTSSPRVAIVPGTCSASAVESCEFALIAPTLGATISSTGTTLPSGLVLIGNGDVTPGTPVSDTFLAQAGTAAVVFAFNSDLVEGVGVPPLVCPLTTGCNFAETGGPQPQTAYTVTWSDGTVDSIQFQSDLDQGTVVPEPASLILLGSGLAIAGGFLRRRRPVIPSV